MFSQGQTLWVRERSNMLEEDLKQTCTKLAFLIITEKVNRMFYFPLLHIVNLHISTQWYNSAQADFWTNL